MKGTGSRRAGWDRVGVHRGYRTGLGRRSLDTHCVVERLPSARIKTGLIIISDVVCEGLVSLWVRSENRDEGSEKCARSPAGREGSQESMPSVFERSGKTHTTVDFVQNPPQQTETSSDRVTRVV